MNPIMQRAGLACLTLLAVIMLWLIGSVIAAIGAHITPDGRIPSSDAFGLTALLLSFREIIASIRALYDTEARTQLTQQLGNSTPVTDTPQPVVVANPVSDPVPVAAAS